MSLYKISLFFDFNFFYFLLILEERTERERQRQRHWSVASCMRPNRESNMPPGVRDEALTVQGFPHFLKGIVHLWMYAIEPVPY